MRSALRPGAPATRLLVATTLVATALAACAGPAVTSRPAATGTSSPTAGASPTPSSIAAEATPTAVPGGRTVDPEPVPTRVPTTQTEWGEILDAVPATFPMIPGAKIGDGADGPVSLSLTVPVTTDAAATWYRDALAGKGYSVELADPLEDGARVLDAASDLPECRIRMDFRPAPGSTMISVLYAAGCGGLGS